MTPQEAAARFTMIVAAFENLPKIITPDQAPARRFGGQACKIHGSIFVMLALGHLVVKLPRHRVEELIHAGRGMPFDTGKPTPMREWLVVTSDDEATALTLAQEACDFVASRHRTQIARRTPSDEAVSKVRNE